MKKIRIVSIITLLALLLASTAFALPDPDTAHYPRGGKLTLSSSKETNNTYAFKATGKHDTRVSLQINEAYADVCGTAVTVQMFIINEWGNWIAFGQPETILLCCVPTSHELSFTIREKQPFCIQVSSYGAEGKCVIPYQVTTS